MNPEVQVGLIVAVTTLLSASIAAVATLRSVTTSQRREESNRRRDERKEIYIDFLEATEEMIAAVEECERLRSEPDRPSDDAALRDAKQHLWHTQQRLRRANTTLRLLGNEDADTAGYAVARLLAYRRPDGVELPPDVTLDHEQYQQWRQGLQKARYAFTEVARADLGLPRSSDR